MLEMLFRSRSQLKPSTVDDVLFLHRNFKRHAKHQIVQFPGVPFKVSNFPSGAGRASVSIYSGSGRVRNVILRYGWVQVFKNKTRVLILGHGGEGIGGRNVGFGSLKIEL